MRYFAQKEQRYHQGFIGFKLSNQSNYFQYSNLLMNKTSITSASLKATAALRAIKRPPAADAQDTHKEASLIDQLKFDQDIEPSKPTPKPTTNENRRLQEHFKISTNANQEFQIYHPFQTLQTSKRIKSAKNLQNIGSADFNTDSKIRLQHKYQEALQKLSELKSHYRLLQSEKQDILSHTNKTACRKGKKDF